VSFLKRISVILLFENKMNTIPVVVSTLNVEDLTKYPDSFIEFADGNNLKYPKLNTGNGQALCAMLLTPGKHWSRHECDEFVKKFNITTRDSIQLFNKHEQWGIKTSSERGKNYIVEPYTLSNKHKMRKNFTYDGTDEQKNAEIEKIKSTIKADYVDIANSEWQLGHKNPNSTDNAMSNLVLQPPIQAKYRDKYIFLDTLTKIPTPKTFQEMNDANQLPYTKEQLINLRDYLNSLEL
jgi:hypothetical protein